MKVSQLQLKQLQMPLNFKPYCLTRLQKHDMNEPP